LLIKIVPNQVGSTILLFQDSEVISLAGSAF
jgi:hypothetical protein